MKLQRGDKTFMACLEHIPWCIRLCSLDVERSGGKKKEKKAGGLFAALRRARRQKLAASKLQWGRWQCELRNSASLKTAGRVCKDSGSCLSASPFVCRHLMAAAIKGGKRGGGEVDADCVLILHSFILLIIYMSMHHFSYVTKEVWYWRCSHREW